MNVGEIFNLFRLQTDDVAAPYLWPDEELFYYLNEAEREACRRARLLVDSSTAATCQISVVADTATYDLDSRVIFVRRARLALEDDKLDLRSFRDLDESVVGWEDDSTTPEALIQDWQTGKILLYPNPDTNDTLNMMVVRDPLNDMNDAENTPEINARYHESLIYWMKYRAYMKEDEEVKDEAKALKNLALFEDEFGKKSSAIDEVYQQRNLSSLEDGEF